MRNRAALFFLAALIALCAAALGGCTPQGETTVRQDEPDLSVNISVPYATTTPTPVPEDPDSPFSLDANGKVTVLNEQWIDEGFASVDGESSQETSDYAQLRLGSQGQDVQTLQLRLRDLNYYRGDISGVFDTLTEQAVQLFELTYGSMQTGIATAALQEMLFAQDAPAYSAMNYAEAIGRSFTQLQLGDVGSNVLALQYRLQELGYPLSRATGQYDQSTAEAVNLFFETYGNGQSLVATPSMQNELFTVDARTYSGATLEPTQAPLYDFDTFAEGSMGTTVEKIQARLIELGYLQGEVTGTFDAATTQAVATFQSVIGMSQDGAVSTLVYSQLFSEDAPTYGSYTATSAMQSGYVLLQQGDSGDAVLRLQNRLVELGYANGAPNGQYAEATVSAVRLFQRGAGLEQTGVANAVMQTLLYSDAAPSYVAPDPTTSSGDRLYPYELTMTDLREGSTGDLVLYLQARLRQLAYYDGAGDGIYGASTSAAVRAAQKNLGLVETGIATASFQEHLYSDAMPDADVSLYSEQQSFEELGLGDVDEESMGPVERLQKQLWELGYLDREAIRGSEGYYNDVTQTAVVEAQLAMGYVSADGAASQEFQAFIFSQYCARIKK